MGLINLAINKDSLNNKAFYLANADKSIISVINNIEKKSGTFKFNGYDEIEFTVVKKDDTLVFEEITDTTLVYIDEIGYFKLFTPSYDDSDGVKTITCKGYSNEYELNGRCLNSFAINTGDVGSIGNYNDGYVVFYNPDNVKLSLMNLVLEKYPNWSIGHVDENLKNEQRTFSIDGTTVYEFLMNDVAKTLNCIFIFDTINNIINVYSLDDKYREINPVFGANTDIYITNSNLAKSISCKSLSDDGIKTAIRVRGADDMDIRDANCGFDYLFDLSFYYSQMDSLLKEKWEQYLKDWESKIPEYSSTILEANKVLTEMNKIQYSDYPDTINEKTEYTEYSITYLKTLLDYVEKEIAGCDASYYDPSNKDYTKEKNDQYNEYKKNKEKIENAISTRQSEWDQKNIIYKEKLVKPTQIHLSLELGNYFTINEYFKLIPFIKEGDYTDNTYAIYDIFTDEQKQNKRAQLRLTAKEALSKLSQPQYSITTDLVNLFNMKEFSNWWDKFQLGNFFTIIFNNDYYIQQRLITVKINDFSDMSSIDVEYSNMTKSSLGISDIDYLLDQTVSTSTGNSVGSSSSVGTTDDKYATVEEIKNLIINSGITSGASFTAVELKKISDLVQGKFDTLSGKFLTVDDFVAENGIIKYLNSNIITTDYINGHLATYDEVNTLKILTESIKGKVADFDTLLSGSTITGSTQTIHLTAANTTLDDTFIKNLLANWITAKAIFGDSISTNDFMVKSNDGRLVITGNTISIKDKNNITRIQIGEDTNGNFSFLLLDETGKGVLIDSNGITENAIGNGLIKSEKLADKSDTYEGISADKLNIDSVVTGINNGSTTINSTKVYFDKDKKSLETIMQEMSTKVTSVDGKLLYDVEITSSNGTSIVDTTVLTAKVYKYGTTEVVAGDFTYQWYLNGEEIPNATSSNYTVNATSLVNGGQFTCKIQY